MGQPSGTQAALERTPASRWQVLVDDRSGATEALALRGYEVWHAPGDTPEFEALVALDPDVVVSAGEHPSPVAFDATDLRPTEVLGRVRARCLDHEAAESELRAAIEAAPDSIRPEGVGLRPRSVLRALAHGEGSYRARVKSADVDVQIEIAAGGLGIARGRCDGEPVVGLEAIRALLRAGPGAVYEVSRLAEASQSYMDYPSLQDALLRALAGKHPKQIRSHSRPPSQAEGADTAVLSLVMPADAPAPIEPIDVEISSMETESLRRPAEEHDSPPKHPTVPLRRRRTPRGAATVDTTAIRLRAQSAAEELLGSRPNWRARFWWAGWAALALYAVVREWLA